eukprot:TRINITY_DN3188_c0_g1_i3.p1 TRINITY_DN3188_c0_g1~~TRINITY_DN3188_c0_g1_i3.p1  ORF type:complete len:222 (+),score=-13.64 TRINITY_DN3188_c0_g1_i3:377-1042(+)
MLFTIFGMWKISAGIYPKPVNILCGLTFLSSSWEKFPYNFQMQIMSLIRQIVFSATNTKPQLLDFVIILRVLLLFNLVVCYSPCGNFQEKPSPFDRYQIYICNYKKLSSLCQVVVRVYLLIFLKLYPATFACGPQFEMKNFKILWVQFSFLADFVLIFKSAEGKICKNHINYCIILKTCLSWDIQGFFLNVYSLNVYLLLSILWVCQITYTGFFVHLTLLK